MMTFGVFNDFIVLDRAGFSGFQEVCTHLAVGAVNLRCTPLPQTGQTAYKSDHRPRIIFNTKSLKPDISSHLALLSLSRIDTYHGDTRL